MIAYADGSEASVGDRVDHDGTPGVIEAVIDSAAAFAAWGLDEPGLMIASTAYGLIFTPVDAIDWDALILLERHDA